MRDLSIEHLDTQFESGDTRPSTLAYETRMVWIATLWALLALLAAASVLWERFSAMS